MLVPEATTIIRNYMENHNIDAISSRRVDVSEYKLFSFFEIKDQRPFVGIDLFAFKKTSKLLEKILPVDLFIGHYYWDTYWNCIINHELPYNICYHIEHASEWSENIDKHENKHNMEMAHRHLQGIEFEYQDSKRL